MAASWKGFTDYLSLDTAMSGTYSLRKGYVDYFEVHIDPLIKASDRHWKYVKSGGKGTDTPA